MRIIVFILSLIIIFVINFIYVKTRKKDMNKIIYFIVLFLIYIFSEYAIIAFKTPEKIINFYFPEQKIIEIYNYKNKSIVITDKEIKVLWKFNNKWRYDLIDFYKIKLSFVYSDECSLVSYKYNKHDTIISISCYDSRIDKQKKYLVTDINDKPLNKIKSIDNGYYGIIENENYFKINGEKIKINN